MAAALVEHARSHSIEPKPDSVKEFHIYPGEGIYGEVDGRDIHIGNKRIAARVLCETGTIICSQSFNSLKHQHHIPISIFFVFLNVRNFFSSAIQVLTNLQMQLIR